MSKFGAMEIAILIKMLLYKWNTFIFKCLHVNNI